MARNFTRLFRPEKLFQNQRICLSLQQTHHLGRVLRLKKNDYVHVFNKAEGEWLAIILEDAKKQFIVEVQENVCLSQPDFSLNLIFAPLKPRAMDFLIEKGTELGVTSFHPFWSERTQRRDFKEDRYKIIAQEAVEQSERFGIPTFQQPLSLQQLLVQWNSVEKIYVGDERRQALSLFDCLQAPISIETKDSTSTLSMTMMVGPEGGFTDSEFDLLQNQKFCVFVSLSQTILKAETAALCALAFAQAQICSRHHRK